MFGLFLLPLIARYDGSDTDIFGGSKIIFLIFVQRGSRQNAFTVGPVPKVLQLFE